MLAAGDTAAPPAPRRRERRVTSRRDTPVLLSALSLRRWRRGRRWRGRRCRAGGGRQDHRTIGAGLRRRWGRWRRRWWWRRRSGHAPAEALPHGHSDDSRLPDVVADTGAKTALTIERELRIHVKDIVDVGRHLKPAIPLQPD